LPVYYSENYLSLLPGESRTVAIEAAATHVGDDPPAVALDGWNVTAAMAVTPGIGELMVVTDDDAHVNRKIEH
jgi:beta-mannosidase